MYKILAIGDSVMWGQGLLDKDKMTGLTAQYIKGLGHTASLALIAHSGARILMRARRGDTPPTRNKTEADIHPYLFGEIPKMHPNMYTQLQIAAGTTGYGTYLNANSYDVPRQQQHKSRLRSKFDRFGSKGPDLILLNGGINDLDAFQIASPFPQRHKAFVRDERRRRGFIARLNPGVDKRNFEALVREFVYERMTRFLASVRREFPDSPIIVTGYYPFFTPGTPTAVGATKMASLILATSFATNPLGTPIVLPTLALLGRRFLIKRSRFWYELSNKYLKKAIADHNRGGPKRIFLAQPEFGKTNGAFCRSSYIFTFNVGGLNPDGHVQVADVNDKAERARRNAFDQYLLTLRRKKGARSQVYRKAKKDKAQTYRASIGHPNEKGARAYYRAIRKVLRDNRRVFGL